jgi:hypothetical protein
MEEADAPRVFTFEEARRMIPTVRAETRGALERLRALEVPIDAEGLEEDRQDLLQKAAAEILADWAERIEKLGIEVKGPWLVDFDSGAGYYCWKWPEESLEYFHDYEAGFAGRVRIH